MSSTRSIGIFVAIAGLSAAGVALGYTGEKFASQAKLSIDQAQAVALKARPGKITVRTKPSTSTHQQIDDSEGEGAEGRAPAAHCDVMRQARLGEQTVP